MQQAFYVAHERLNTDLGFRDQVIQFLGEHGIDTERLFALGTVDWEMTEPLITIGAVRLLGYETSALVNEIEGEVLGKTERNARQPSQGGGLVGALGRNLANPIGALAGGL